MRLSMSRQEMSALNARLETAASAAPASEQRARRAAPLLRS
jgi:hypothetical protein